MHVAVAIVGFGNAEDVVRCFAALARSDYPDFEVVVCENGGVAAFATLQRAIPCRLPNGQSVQLIQAAGNGGYASGVNLCMAASPKSDAWWILNPDTEPSAGAMRAMVERLKAGCDAVGGPLSLPNGIIQSYGGRWRAWLARSVSIGYGASLEAETDTEAIEQAQNYLNGASMLVSRRFLETTGPMREEFFLYCEEIDWCLRAASRGMRLGFAPASHVFHRQGTTTGYHGDLATRSRLSVYLDERNKMLLTRYHFPARLPVAALSAFLLIVLRYLRRGAVRQFGYGISGWLAGLQGKCGVPTWMRAAEG
ncbi:MAG TPA: glycosyltransferase family 2 protein [Rhizomicrobium sp.]|nr:glycosyltransferase family 2 protein [Rhizomicrobium sp.]